MLAWTCRIVARAETRVMSGAIIAVLASMGSGAVLMGLIAIGLPPAAAFGSSALMGFLFLAMLVTETAKIPWRKATAVAAIFTIAQFGFFMLVSPLLAD
ncbi:MAG TPA: hypothetical protein VFF65_03435 [Phycisphaerales bacterium]|nr:hypothetical protein [Phycisphaerales bacterium]